jgi:hypothetical protein
MKHDLEQLLVKELKQKLIGTLSQKTGKPIVDVSVTITDEEEYSNRGGHSFTVLNISVLTETGKTKKQTWEKYNIW